MLWQMFQQMCYMNEARIKVWRKKTPIGAALKLCSLPPTTEAYTENVKRAHLQAAHWKASIEGTCSAPYRCPDAWLGAQRILLKAHDCARGKPVCPMQLLSWR